MDRDGGRRPRRTHATAASDARATSRFCGYGSPWLMRVDSSATTGRPAAMAAETSGLTSSRSVSIGAA